MKKFGRITAVIACVVAAVAVPDLAHASTAPSCPLPVFGPGSSYHPAIHLADFSPDITNGWFPLRPGRTYRYTGTKDGKEALDVFQPSAATKTIDGVVTRVVNDGLFLDNALEERTTDYYAQDRCGNVWYFGPGAAVVRGRDRRGRRGSAVAGPRVEL